MPTQSDGNAALRQQQTDGNGDRMPSNLDIDRFLANPCEYFDYSLTRMTGLPRAHVERLQIAGLKQRFAQFRGALPMLDKLADSQNINAVDQLDDVLPLLFGHEMFKSYPASLLDKHRYAQLSTWLNKLTTLDLSKIDVSVCRSIDDWMITLSRETELAVIHTSGTSGTMSFLPRTKSEWIKFVEGFAVHCFQRFGKASPTPTFPMNVECVYPYFRTGGLSHTLTNDATVVVIAGSEERFHAAYPERLSADLLLLAARHRAAAAKGQLNRLVISPELAARREEFEAQQRDMPRRLADFFTTMQTKLAGQHIFMMAPSSLLYPMAAERLKKGMRKLFAPDSVIITGGGGKGIALPEDWQETVKEFFGVERLHYGYGMSEMVGSFWCCEHGHYHGDPWIIPFVLDPDTAKPLPRSGTVTGRFAFYDLIPDTRWGGFVTGDEVTMEWDIPCPCGQTTPYLTGTIQRLSEKRDEGGEEKINCAAAPQAYAEALDFLNQETE